MARIAAAALFGAALCADRALGLDDTSALMQQSSRAALSAEMGLEMDNGFSRVKMDLDDLESGMNKLVTSIADIREATEPVSLLEEDAAVGTTNAPFKERVADWKGRVGERVNKVTTGLNKGVSSVNARLEHSVGNMMSKANSVVDDVHSSASNALQGVKDFTDAASEPISKKVNTQAGLLNSKVKVMITKINRAIDDMKGGVRDLAHGVTEGMKEASEKIAAQLAQSVHEHVRQEIELARAAEPASLLEIGSGAAVSRSSLQSSMSKARVAVDMIRASTEHAFTGMAMLMDNAAEKLVEHANTDADASAEVEDMVGSVKASISDAQASVRDSTRSMTDSLQAASESIAM
eukprot:CAMPEP_0171171656 /NCGR_PEP_ID=MMETSP0790-20130122/9326_1 /TAXON_ID=2925 /ORGANISM="Alexandrium catenella, Strain OF101" /LENGTH=349 /DNA_ID=CAMNT_0011636509 /DNA_START=60 /DNA_END=1109 /DNA_ORIENTATION=-